eukprot:TRINITY_DN49542_c0_g1_i2.p1 TRINITY_DN49542_c0_g1~~TRINITY_DN49542_c0_g1_i2.p1  ORF type:complete len:411 (+),score=122.39 TRINITY_DN49542_c0_g1_i2:453-1685(+)
MAVDEAPLQAVSLHVLMSVVKRGEDGELDKNLCYHLVRHLLSSPFFQPALVRVFVKEYLCKYADVCAASLAALKQLCRQHGTGNPASAQYTAEEMFTAPRVLDSKDLVRNVVTIMLSLPKPLADLDLLAEEAPLKPGALKGAGSAAWLQVLQLPMEPAGLYLSVLKGMHSKVLPWLKSPLALSDFLTRSYNVGGLPSVLALSGLFDLMTVHNLEYPDFYSKLYKIVQPGALQVQYKTRFWELLNICLVSSMKLPAYLVAGFAKKLARLALTASPSGAMVAMAVVFNMIKKHSSLLPLLQRDSTTEKSFDAETEDITKCNALDDSLWELTALQQHYCPEVATVAKAFKKDFTARGLKPFEPEEFVDQGYELLLDEELAKKHKRETPLSFDKVGGLFAQPLFADVWDMRTKE